MKAFAHHFTYEFSTGLRNSTQLLMNYLFPLAFFVMMGLVMTQINPGFKEVLVPAMVVFAALSGSLLGLPSPLVEQRESGVFRTYKINGVPAAAILMVPALSVLVHLLIVAIVIALAGPAFFGGVAPTNWLAFLAVTLLMGLSCAGIGALIGVLFSSSRSVVLVTQAIFLPSMLLGGLMMPLSVLPASVRSVSAVLPATHAMQALSDLAFGQAALWDVRGSVAILLAGGLLSFALAIYLFDWDSRNVTRRGHPALGLLALAPYLAGLLLA